MIAATYFDGRLATAHAVELAIDRDRVRVSGASVARDEPFADIAISDRIGDAPRLVRFRDGAHCEVSDAATFDGLLAARGIHGSRVAQWEANTRIVGGAVAGLFLAATLAYFILLPAAASVVAMRMPSEVMRGLSDQTLRWLDRTLLEQSFLTRERRMEIWQALNRLQPPLDHGYTLSLQFRRSAALGANAFALPSGLIVVTDDLVRLSADDREIIAVLAHEVGHVARRHGVRRLAQGMTLTVLLSWYVGDVSTLAAAAPTVLLTTKYSRDFEREADDYAAQLLAANGISSAYLASILERLEAAHTRRTGEGRMQFGYISTHPATAERLARLRGR